MSVTAYDHWILTALEMTFCNYPKLIYLLCHHFIQAIHTFVGFLYTRGVRSRSWLFNLHD